MSIARLVRATVVGPSSAREEVLADLQRAGILHVVSLVPPVDREGPALSSEATTALRYLQTAPIQRAPVHRPAIDLLEVQRRALELKSREADLDDERDYLEAKAKALAPWGDFELPELGALGRGPNGPIRMWFYEIPTYRLPQLEGRDLAWEIVAREPGVAYVVVLSDREPDDMPAPRSRTGSRSLSSVRERLRAVDEELEELVFQRAELTKYRLRFEEHLDDLLDGFAREEVGRMTYDDGPLFALSGWIPERSRDALAQVAAHHRLAFTHRPPRAGELPPTLLENRGLARAGQSLVTFYTTPNYFEWDPSPVVLLSFAVFFAMIMSDAGYALLLLAGLALFWGPAGRALGGPLRGLFALMLGLSVGWGVAVGSYFGVTPPATSTLGALRVLRLDDYDMMMRVTITVGAGHVILANILRAWFVPASGVLGAIGWCVAISTGLLWWLGQSEPAVSSWIGAASSWLFGGSAALILLFSSTSRALGPRLLTGARALTNVTAAFGDVLSYLRLFALGLASTSLGLAFNDLAQDAAQTEGVGLLLSVVVLLVGHGINIGLAIMSGFVHGLRLNFIEFFRWGTTAEGRPFRAFALRQRAGRPAESSVE